VDFVLVIIMELSFARCYCWVAIRSALPASLLEPGQFGPKFQLQGVAPPLILRVGKLG